MRLWFKSCPPRGKPNDGQVDAAKKQMEEIHKATEDLRACYTFAAAEKASLTLLAALLEMASSPLCRDPFSCLQEAALFASQGTKSGNSDISLENRLPPLCLLPQ